MPQNPPSAFSGAQNTGCPVAPFEAFGCVCCRRWKTKSALVAEPNCPMHAHNMCDLCRTTCSDVRKVVQIQCGDAIGRVLVASVDRRKSEGGEGSEGAVAARGCRLGKQNRKVGSARITLLLTPAIMYSLAGVTGSSSNSNSKRRDVRGL